MFNLQIFCFFFVTEIVHTTDADATRFDCFVASISVVWNKH